MVPHRLGTLSAGSDQGVVGDHVWTAAIVVHLVEQAHSHLPLARLLAGRDQGAVGDHIALAVAGHHVLEDLQSRLQLQGSSSLSAMCSLPKEQGCGKRWVGCCKPEAQEQCATGEHLTLQCRVLIHG